MADVSGGAVTVTGESDSQAIAIHPSSHEILIIGFRCGAADLQGKTNGNTCRLRESLGRDRPLSAQTQHPKCDPQPIAEMAAPGFGHVRAERSGRPENSSVRL